jgi:hypothetical protein
MRPSGAARIILPFVCASAILGAGCGGSASKSDPLGASAPAAALANAINLRQADVPGLSARFDRDRETRSGPLGNCDQASARAPIGFLSQRFSRGGTRVLPTESVSSGVYLMASEAQAVREFDALGSARARACIGQEVVRTIKKGERERAEPLLATPVQVVSLAPPYYLDQCGFVVGRVLVELLAVGSPHPLPLVTERRLLALLYSRAQAHELS